MTVRTPVATTAEARIAELLRERILAGGLGVGDRLRQVELAAELGVSTTPVREALRALAAEGLLRIDSHRGAVVQRLEPAEQLEVYQLQLLVELDNLGHAVPAATPEALAVAAAAQEAMRGTDDSARWVLLNRDFHLALAAPAGRPRAHRLLTELLNVTAVQIRDDLDRWVGRRGTALAEHDAILAAVAAGDVERAREVLREHTLAPMRNLHRALGLPPP